MLTSSEHTKNLVLTGVFAALTAVCAWITLPLPFTPVPINLALLGVYLSACLLGSHFGLYSQLIYILLGAIGLPVFSGFSGGFAILVGPTGGYILGYAFAAFITGLLAGDCTSVKRLIAAMVCGCAVCYAFGSLWYMLQSGTGLVPTLLACVVPFLPGDALKIAAAVLLVRRLRVLRQE